MRYSNVLTALATFLVVSALFILSLTVASAAPHRLGGPSIELQKTVGTNGGVCATTDVVTVTAGTQVYYCYEVTNTGGVTLTRHDLEDSELGVILNNFPFTLVPGASAFITQTTSITETTVNTGTWTSYNPGPSDVVSDTDTATVIIAQASIEMDKTVGTDGGTCAASNEITVTEPAQVYYCYRVTNTGPVTLTRHDLEDSELGVILNNFPFTLVPGASAFITQTTFISVTTVNTATWTAYNPGPLDVVSDTDVATVTLELPTSITLLDARVVSESGDPIWRLVGMLGLSLPLVGYLAWRLRRT